MKTAYNTSIVVLLLISGRQLGFSQPNSKDQDGDRPPTFERLNEMVQNGDPQAVPILRRQLVTESEWLAEENKAKRLLQAIDGLGQFQDAQVIDTIVAIYRQPKSAARVHDSAALAIARTGTSSELQLLKNILWDDRLSLRSRCESAVTLLQLDVPEAAEFLLIQYDLYRLEFRTASHYRMVAVRSALERLDNDQILTGLDQRLKTERHFKMQNNIRTLKERMAFNRLSLDELRQIAANPDWKTGMYRRYRSIKVLAARGGPELIPFLNSLEPWKTDVESYAKTVAGHNRVIWPQFVAEAIGGIRRRHWQTATKANGKPNTGSTLKSSAPVTKPTELRVLRGHTAPVRRLTVSHDGRYLVSVALGHWRGVRRSTNEWIVWDLETRKIVHRDQDPRQKLILKFRVTDAAFLPKTYSVMTVGQDHSVWDALTGKSISKNQRGRNVHSSFGLSLSPDGKRFVYSMPGLGQNFWSNIATGKDQRVNVADARLMSFLPDGQLLLSCGEFGNRLRTYDIDRDKLGEMFSGKTSTIRLINISPDGKTAATTSGTTGPTALWDIPGRKLSSQSIQGGCVCFAPNSRQLVAGGHNGQLIVVDLTTGAELHRFIAQRDLIHAVAYLPTGQHVLTTGGGGFPSRANEPTADYAIRLWQLPQLKTAANN